MAELTVQSITRSGVTPSFSSAASGGDTFANDGNTFLEVKNGGSEITVTISSQVTSPEPGQAASDVTVTVPATTGDKMIGPFPKHAFNNASGQVEVAYSAVTSVTVAAVKIPR